MWPLRWRAIVCPSASQKVPEEVIRQIVTERALFDLSLKDKYRLDDGVVFMTGLQAVARASISASPHGR